MLGTLGRDESRARPTPWRGIRDPEERLAEALGEIYAFYGRTEPMMANLVRDAPKMPALAERLAPYGQYLAAVRDILAAGWGRGGGGASCYWPPWATR